MNSRETLRERLERERIGVSGDPTPDHEYGDVGANPHPDIEPQREPQAVEYITEQLTDETALSEKQARVWLLRDVEGLNPQDTAQRAGISESTMYDHLAIARRKIEQAERLVNITDELTK